MYVRQYVWSLLQPSGQGKKQALKSITSLGKDNTTLTLQGVDAGFGEHSYFRERTNGVIVLSALCASQWQPLVDHADKSIGGIASRPIHC